MDKEVNQNKIKNEILEYTNNLSFEELKKTVIYKKLPQSLRKSYIKSKEQLVSIIIDYLILCEEVKYMNNKYPDHKIYELNKFCNINIYNKEKEKIKKSKKSKKDKGRINKILLKIKNLFKLK
jgi:hypothetical protein